MNIVTLDEVKRYIKYDLYDTDRDAEFTDTAEASEEMIMNYINRDFDDLFDNWCGVPVSIKMAVKMVFASFVKNPEADSTFVFNQNPQLYGLINPYRKL